jgi:hypothetical protein
MQTTHKLHTRQEKSKPVGKSRKSINKILSPEKKEVFENRHQEGTGGAMYNYTEETMHTF